MPGLFDTLAAAARKRKDYNRIVAELTSLSDRDLGEIGISRYDAARIAREAVYGK